MEELYAIPAQWKWVTLENIGKTYSGATPKTSDQSNFDGDIPWITPADLTGYTAQHISKGRRNISKKGLNGSSAKIVPEGTILFSSRAPIGYVAIASNPLCTNQGFKSIKPYEGVDSKFVYYYLKSAKELAESRASGTTFRELSGSRFVKLPIPLAPTSEQKRIVDKIELLFSDLDKGEALLKQVQKQLATYRQSVFKAAVNGELTKGESQKHALPKWRSSLLEDVILSKPRNGFSPKGVDYKTSVKNLTLTATTSGTFKPEYFKYVDIEVEPDSHLWLEDGDILIQRANSIDYVGVSAIYRGPSHTFIYPDLMMKVRANETLIITEFLYLVLSSSAARNFFASNATGTAGSMPKINQKIVMATPVLVPSIQEQEEIVNQVENAFFKIKTLEAWCARELKRSATLRQSILKAAFSGQLVPQNSMDEPAGALLARIQFTCTKQSNTAIGKPLRRNHKSKKSVAA
jgi:type I restriction enzyme S subunit